MTWDQLHDYAAEQLGPVMDMENDWRPAVDMYLDDVLSIWIDQSHTVHVDAINGIRIWLNNGDSIIYVTGGGDHAAD